MLAYKKKKGKRNSDDERINRVVVKPKVGGISKGRNSLKVGKVYKTKMNWIMHGQKVRQGTRDKIRNRMERSFVKDYLEPGV